MRTRYVSLDIAPRPVILPGMTTQEIRHLQQQIDEAVAAGLAELTTSRSWIRRENVETVEALTNIANAHFRRAEVLQQQLYLAQRITLREADLDSPHPVQPLSEALKPRG